MLPTCARATTLFWPLMYTGANWQCIIYRIVGNFWGRKLLWIGEKIQFLRRKLSRIAHLCCTKGCPQISTKLWNLQKFSPSKVSCFFLLISFRAHLAPEGREDYKEIVVWMVETEVMARGVPWVSRLTLHVGSCDVMWDHVMSCGIMWCHLPHNIYVLYVSWISCNTPCYTVLHHCS